MKEERAAAAFILLPSSFFLLRGRSVPAHVHHHHIAHKADAAIVHAEPGAVFPARALGGLRRGIEIARRRVKVSGTQPLPRSTSASQASSTFPWPPKPQPRNTPSARTSA